MMKKKNFTLFFVWAFFSINAQTNVNKTPSNSNGVAQNKSIAAKLDVDSDGDGVLDSVDLDDDNDGILDLIECPDILNSYEYRGTFGTISNACRDLQSPLTSNYHYYGDYYNNLLKEGAYVVTSYSKSVSIHYKTDHWDHLYGHTTGTADDAYLAVNGSIDTGIFYKQTISVNRNKTYELSLYAINAIVSTVYVGDPADIGIRVKDTSGNEVAFTSTGLMVPTYKPTGSDVLPSDWIRASLQFNSGTNTTLFLEVFNVSLGAADNDFAIDDVSIVSIDKPNCTDTDNDLVPDYIDLDSDNDGCLDAIEGAENVTTSMLVKAASGLTVGTGSPAQNGNLCAGSACVDTDGVPLVVDSGGAADTGADQGQDNGDSTNSSVSSQCICYKPAVTSGTALDTQHGITALGRAGSRDENWPMERKGAWMALEALSKGFVINRLTAAEISNIPASNLFEGMMVYDTTNNCLKIYTSVDFGTTYDWHCINTQTCN